MRRKLPRKRTNRQIFLFAVLLFAVLAGFAYVYEFRVAPVIKEVAATQAENVMTNVIENAIIEVLKANNVTYSSLVDIEKDSEGKITAIKADTVKMNSLKSEISSAVSEKVLDMDNREIKIPLGTIVGISALSGKGPRIATNVTLANNVNSAINNSFTSAGINQTLHEIIVEINADIYVVMPGARVTAQVNTNFCIAQTVIIGAVPETFAEFQNTGEKNE